MTPREASWPTRGLTLRGFTWGDPSHGPLVILHGFLDQSLAWDAVAQHLPGHHVVAPDHRGHGLSDAIGPEGWYHFWDYVADVDDLVAQLPGPIDLVGHSMGGTIATLFAACRPEAVRRLVLIEGLGPPDTAQVALPRARAFLDDRRSPPLHAPFPDASVAADRIHRHTGAAPDTALRLARRILRPVNPADPAGPLTWTWDARHRGRSPHPFRHDVHLQMLAALTCPVLLLDGERSPWRPDGLQERRDAIPHSEHALIPMAAHNPHHDAPEATAHRIAAFLANAPAGQ